MFLGFARGKVGSVVFSRRKGEQITRSRNENPANPRTMSQQEQRVKMIAPVQFYKTAVSTFFKFAFDDKKEKESDYNAFIRRNLREVPGPYFTKNMYNLKYPAFAPWIVSGSSFPQIMADVSYYNDDFIKIAIPVAINSSSTTHTATVGEVSKEIIAAYPQLQDGDMLTFLIGADTEGGENLANGTVAYYGNKKFYYLQFVLDTFSTVEMNNPETDKLKAGQIGLSYHGDTPESSGLEQGGTYLMASFDLGVGNYIAYIYGIIQTRKTNSKVLASNCALQMNGLASEYYDVLSTYSALERAAISYGGRVAILDPDKGDRDVTYNSNRRQGIMAGSAVPRGSYCERSMPLDKGCGCNNEVAQSDDSSCECNEEPCDCNCNEDEETVIKTRKTRKSSESTNN